jgi:hypothetical protein
MSSTNAPDLLPPVVRDGPAAENEITEALNDRSARIVRPTVAP